MPSTPQGAHAFSDHSRRESVVQDALRKLLRKRVVLYWPVQRCFKLPGRAVTLFSGIFLLFSEQYRVLAALFYAAPAPAPCNLHEMAPGFFFSFSAARSRSGNARKQQTQAVEADAPLERSE